MKTTLDMPDALFRRAKSAAAERGISLRLLVSEALAEKLALPGTGESPWMTSFGKLRSLRRESARIDRVVRAEFDRVEPWNPWFDETAFESEPLHRIEASSISCS
jgi:hypothetical protein